MKNRDWIRQAKKELKKIMKNNSKTIPNPKGVELIK